MAESRRVNTRKEIMYLHFNFIQPSSREFCDWLWGQTSALIGPSVPRRAMKTGQILIRLRPDKRVNSSGLLV